MLRDGHEASSGRWEPDGDSNSRWASEGKAKSHRQGLT